MKQLQFFFALYCFTSLFGAEYTIDTITIQSSALHESRQILLFKPKGIEKQDSVSMLYMVDGESSNYYYKSILDQEHDFPIMGIGIVQTNRKRDLLYAHNAVIFLEFIAKELIPAIEEGYKTAERILFGHSFAGSFTIFSMLNEPGLFSRYLASSPTPIMDMVDSSLYIELDRKLSTAIDFYFSWGSKDMKQIRKWGQKLESNLLSVKVNKIEWGNDILEGENHSTSSLVSLKRGVKY